MPPYLKITFASEQEKQEIVAWAAAHGSPASKFLRSVLQELMAASGKPDRQGRRVAALQVRVQSLEAELALKDGQLADLRAQVLRQADLLQARSHEGPGELPLRLIKVIEKERVVFFDDEAEEYLRRYLKVRAFRLKDPENRQLWLGSKGNLKKGGLDNLLRKAAIRAGLHDSESLDMEKHFSAHNCRHFFTTMLDRAGMARRHIQVLRGDVGGEAIDIYLHNDLEEIKKEYLRCMPRLME